MGRPESARTGRVNHEDGDQSGVGRERGEAIEDRFLSAPGFPAYLASIRDNRDLWRAIYSRAAVPPELLERVRSLGRRWNLLALVEPWCGDGASTIPYLARLAEATPDLDLRILARDANPDLMNAHLTAGARSIPVVMILDESYRETGWWGPRPAPLQELFLRELRPLPKPERLLRLRAWYARDRGRTTLGEIVAKIPGPASSYRAGPASGDAPSTSNEHY